MYFMGVVSAIPPSAVLYVHTFSPARAESPAIARLDFLPSIHVQLSLHQYRKRRKCTQRMRVDARTSSSHDSGTRFYAVR
jgi:hypothetical protein